jgi:L-threonylcarbamoyladenylate synthase
LTVSKQLTEMSYELSVDIREQIEYGVSILKKGGIIAYPTDTVYGLGAGMSYTQAIERVYRVKERSLSNPMPLLLSDVNQIEMVADSVPPAARQLMKIFWPGALTLVLPALKSVPHIITAGGNTVAVRIPAHPVPIALVRGLGEPIVGTSANLSKYPSAQTALDVSSQLGDRVDFIIDGGKSPGGIESTIVDVTAEKPFVLREGAISRNEINKAYQNTTF